MNYRITRINDDEGWIFISSEDSYESAESFVIMVKMIAQAVNGKISSAGETQYRISNISYDLIFQWDDLFGIVVIFKDAHEKHGVLKFLDNIGIK